MTSSVGVVNKQTKKYTEIKYVPYRIRAFCYLHVQLVVSHGLAILNKCETRQPTVNKELE